MLLEEPFIGDYLLASRDLAREPVRRGEDLLLSSPTPVIDAYLVL